MIAWQWFKAQDPAREAAVLTGYKVMPIRTIIRLRPDGRMISYEVLPEKTPREVEIPFPARGSQIATDVVDTFEYTLGVGEPGRSVEHLRARHDAFVANLQKFQHPAARAILAFIQSPARPCFAPVGMTPTPEEAARLQSIAPKVGKVDQGAAKKVNFKKPEILPYWANTLATARKFHALGDQVDLEFIADTPRGYVLFEVDGFPEWWFDKVFTDAKIAARRADQGETIGRCSLCYQTKPLARKIDPTVLSKGPKLISFNIDSFCAFGRTQSLTAPTCQDCADSLVRGFNAIVLANHTMKHHPGGSGTHACIWWGPSLGQNLWGIFERAMDKDATEAERLAALDEIPRESFFLAIKQNDRRVAFRRHAYVRGADLRERLTRAVQHGVLFDHVVKAMTWSSAGAEAEKTASAFWREQLLIDLVGGEPLCPRDVLRMQKHLENCVTGSISLGPTASDADRKRTTMSRYTVTHLTRFLTYLGVDMQRREPNTEEERSCFALGQALAHIDRIQFKQNRAMRPHSMRLIPQAMLNPTRVREEILSKSYVRDRFGRMDHDRTVSRLYLEASFLPGRRMNLSERGFFQEGFVSERTAILNYKRNPEDGSPADGDDALPFNTDFDDTGAEASAK